MDGIATSSRWMFNLLARRFSMAPTILEAKVLCFFSSVEFFYVFVLLWCSLTFLKISIYHMYI